MTMLNSWLDGVPIGDIEDAPQSLHDLVEQLGTVPDFVDFTQIDQGAAAFSRHAREAVSPCRPRPGLRIRQSCGVQAP